jgi:hypothetical protein
VVHVRHAPPRPGGERNPRADGGGEGRGGEGRFWSSAVLGWEKMKAEASTGRTASDFGERERERRGQSRASTGGSLYATQFRCRGSRIRDSVNLGCIDGGPG